MTARRVITREAARKLNEMAQVISPELFWTCNYEPTINYAIGQDAAFQLGIQDLYKFAIDTNCVLRTIAFNPKGSVCGDILAPGEGRTLKGNLDLVQAMRSIFDHNQSDLNGRLLVERRDSFENWVRSQIGRNEPSSLDDFDVLCASLETIGAELVGLSETILKRIAEGDDCQAIANKWVDATLEWYCGVSRRDYYLSQLSDYYFARAAAGRRNFNLNTDVVKLLGKVKRWIQLQTTYHFEKDIRRLRDKERELRNSLDESSPFAKVKDVFPDMYEKGLQNSREELQVISRDICYAQREKERIQGEIEDRYHGMGVGYFFERKRFQKQLRETIEDLKSSGEEYTLLPQSLLQLDVERRFSGVPSPDGDFGG